VTARYVLTLQARQDLVDIGNYIAEQSGLEPAEHVLEKLREAFHFLTEQPGVGHIREDLADDPAVRFWGVYSYLVAFVPGDRPLPVVSVVHGSRDPDKIRRHLREATER